MKGSILTFSGLMSLLKHCRVFIIVVTLLCALVGTGITVAGNVVTYHAQSSMVLDDLSGEFTPDELIALVYPIAVSEAADAPEGSVVSVKGPDKNASYLDLRTLVFTATSVGNDSCVQAVNDVVADTVASAQTVLEDFDAKRQEEYEEQLAAVSALPFEDDETRLTAALRISNPEPTNCIFSVTEATSAAGDDVNVPRAAIAYLVIGLVISSCLIIVWALIKAPIKSATDIESVYDLPVVVMSHSTLAVKRIWLNSVIALDNEPETMAFVPVGSRAASNVAFCVGKELEASGRSAIVVDPAIFAGGSIPDRGVVELIQCSPFSESVESIVSARNADAVVVCARQWKCGLRELAETMRELRFADAKIVGFALITKTVS